MRECVICGKPFDWQSSIGRPPMTCSEDCRRVRKNRLSEESRSRAAARGCPDGLHGTSTGYSHYRCTCSACSKWARGYKQTRRRLIKERLAAE